jgi:hypothetical protein
MKEMFDEFQKNAQEKQLSATGRRIYLLSL